VTLQFTSDVAISFLTAIIAITVGIIGWRWRNTPGGTFFTLMMFSIGEWAFFYGMEVASIEIPAKIFWAKLQYIGVASFPLFWLFFILQYTRQTHWIIRKWVSLLIVIPILTIFIAATNETHHWLWNRIFPMSNDPNAPLIYSHGWWFWVAVGYFYLLMLMGAIVLVRVIIRSPKTYRTKTVIILVGPFFPLVGNLIYLTGLNPAQGFNYQMIGLAISSLMYAWGIYRFQLLENFPLARDVLVDKMNEGVIVLDYRDRVYNLNSTALTQLCMTQRSATGKSLHEVLSVWPEVAERLQNQTEVEAEVFLAEDPPKYLDVRKTTLRDKDGNPAGRLVVWRDITRFKQVEETLRESEARFKALLQGAPDAIVITDKACQIIMVNNQTMTLFGYPSDELTGKSIELVIPERYWEAYHKYQQAFIDEVETRPGLSLPLIGVRKNGREIPIEIALSPVKIPSGLLVTNIIRDLTIRKEAEEQLRLQSIALESAANGIVITDRQGNIQWVNSAFTKITGYSADEVRGQNPRILKSGLVDPKLFESLWKTILAGDVWHGELINRRKDGSTYTEEQTIAPVPDSFGQINHFIAIKQDITERKRTEEALNKRSDQIATLNRVMQSLSSTLDLPKVLETILMELQQVIPYDSASVLLSKDDTLEIIAVQGFPDPEVLKGLTFSLSTDDNPNTEVMRTHKPLIVDDAYTTYKSFRTGVHADYQHRGWMGVPMIIGDRVIGMLSLDKRVPNFYTLDQGQLALAFAAQAAIAIENARLYDDAQKELIERKKREEELHKLQEKLEEQAIRDPLTGLYNRRYLDETLSRELSRAERDNIPVGIVMLDLDHFKDFNDKFGHDVGDLMLKQLGKLLSSQVRAGDIACRYGGEEFVVVMPKASLAVAQHRADEWRVKFSNHPLLYQGAGLIATLSAGVAVYPLHGSTSEEMIRKADQAMYAAKTAGRNRVMVAE
jgi:diguanylate cyclase (GGDEF)-like protein/PAS domain S-box-containing protein